MSWTHAKESVLRRFLVGRTRTMTPMAGYSYAEEDETGAQLHVHGAAARRPLLYLPGQAMHVMDCPRAILRAVALLKEAGATCTRLDFALDTEGDATPQSINVAWREDRFDTRFHRLWPQGDMDKPGYYVSTRGRGRRGRRRCRVEFVAYDKREDLLSLGLPCGVQRLSRVEVRFRGPEARRLSAVLAEAAADLPPDEACAACRPFGNDCRLAVDVKGTVYRLQTPSMGEGGADAEGQEEGAGKDRGGAGRRGARLSV